MATSSSTASPTMWSLLQQPRRLIALICAMLSTLSAGTRYAFPLYGLPLSRQLGFSQLQLNVVASVGDIGCYFCAPLFGAISDRFGSRVGCMLAVLFLTSGYYGLSAQLAGEASAVSTSYLWTAFLYWMVGSGSAAACITSVSTVARNFPPSMRGLVLGLPLSFYGLSAFVLSIISAHWFVHRASDGDGSSDTIDTRGFLLFLAVACGSINAVAAWGLRVIPYEADTVVTALDASHTSPTPTTSAIASVHSDSAKLGHVEDEEAEAEVEDQAPSAESSRIARWRQRFWPTRPRSASQTALLGTTPTAITEYTTLSGGDSVRVEENTAAPAGPCHVMRSGESIFSDPNFWLLATVVAIATGTGLMYITNVGSIVRQLMLSHDSGSDDTDVQLAANLHVALISVSSFSARLLAGIVSDRLLQHWHVRRISLLVCVIAMMLLGQLLILATTTPSALILATCVIGGAYGAIFTLCSAIVSEYWGVASFGRNWGWMSCAPGAGGQIFNLLYGSLFDARQAQPGGCQGNGCYRDMFYLTSTACGVGIYLVLLLRWRRIRQTRHAQYMQTATPI